MKPSVYIHKNGIVEKGAKVGARTRIWAFAHILSGANIGEDCNICDHVFIENDVSIGNRVTIKCGVQVWDGVSIDDDVFIGPNVTFTNDAFPRSKQYPEEFLKTLVCKGASIGANATILPGIVIGKNAMIGAGAVVTRNVSPNAIVVGNPAKIIGYVSAVAQETVKPQNQMTEQNLPDLGIGAAKTIVLPLTEDLRGRLVFGEYDQHLPFVPKRFFVISEVPMNVLRGEHAHREQHQFLVCLNGSCSVVLDDGEKRMEVVLEHSNIGLYIPPMIWATLYKYSKDAILLVLASGIYQAEDYIRDYDEFLRLVE